MLCFSKKQSITLNEIVSCDLGMLKKNETVEGILHEGKIHGISRTADLYLVSKISASGKKERPRLNLTVKKELQGLGKKIMAQSGMAKVRILLSFVSVSHYLCVSYC